VGSRKQEQDPGVVRITAAPENPADDIARRQRRYLISMTIRTVCFVGGVAAYQVPWLCFTLIAASLFLPFVAVVIANAAAPRIAEPLAGPGFGGGPGPGQLGSGDRML